MYRLPGVYKIECVVNGKVYVGATIDIKTRINTHWSQLKNNKHKLRPLQEDFNLYGRESFKVSYVEPTLNLKDREDYLIKSLDPTTLYNQQLYSNQYNARTLLRLYPNIGQEMRHYLNRCLSQ